jgi:hypothetical protein
MASPDSLYIREFPADLEIREMPDDGMQVEGLVVPFWGDQIPRGLCPWVM